jgi:hypothetical protein
MDPAVLQHVALLQNKKRKCEEAEEDIILLATSLSAVAAAQYFTMNFVKNPQHTSVLSGRAWMEELLTGHPKRMRDNMGISQAGFQYLEQLLTQNGGLKSARYIDSTERLGIFLYAVTSDLSMRKLAERFQRSTQTIHQAYHHVLQCLISKPIYTSKIKSATDTTPLHPKIEYSWQYSPYFNDCIGAVDGTHIPISPPHDKREPWRDRDGNLTQNVLAICNFDMEFTDLLCGWSGSTADSTLWIEGVRAGAVCIPQGKYVLGDAGFTNCDFILTPYRGVRYHLREWERSNARPKTPKELFNLRHAQLRNIIERIFGVLKERFKILTLPRFFKIDAQVKVVAALCVLHNILVNIREITEADLQEVVDQDEHQQEDGESLSQDQQEGTGTGYRIKKRERKRAGDKRDAIAKAMWEDYVQFHSRHRRPL